MKMHAQLPYRQKDYIVLAESDGFTDWVASTARRQDSNREETAAFIVRACNSHYELLAALEACVAAFDRCTVFNADGTAFQAARAAIAKAKAKGK